MVQKRLATGLKKLGLYPSVDEEKSAATDVKQRLSDLNNQIDSRIRSLHLMSECAGYAAQVAQGRTDEISRQMRKEEKFISDADEILKEGFGVRHNDRGEYEFIDRSMEVVIKFYETKTGRKVNRVDRPQVEQALQTLKTMQLTESERKILKQAFARKWRNLPQCLSQPGICHRLLRRSPLYLLRYHTIKAETLDAAMTRLTR